LFTSHTLTLFDIYIYFFAFLTEDRLYLIFSLTPSPPFLNKTYERLSWTPCDLPALGSFITAVSSRSVLDILRTWNIEFRGLEMGDLGFLQSF